MPSYIYTIYSQKQPYFLNQPLFHQVFLWGVVTIRHLKYGHYYSEYLAKRSKYKSTPFVIACAIFS